MKSNSRRKFLVTSTKVFTGFIGATFLGKYFLFPQDTVINSTHFSTSNYTSMDKNAQKILVIYESKFGSTGEIANIIGETLSKKGNTVEVKKIKDVSNLTTYDSVVIGSPIQYDTWMPEARTFIDTYQHDLSKKQVAFFFTCLTLSRETEKSKQQAIGYADKLHDLVPAVRPLSIGRFAGVLDYSKMSLGSRILAKGLFAILGIKEGDYRDWAAIRSWAEQLKI